MPNEGVYNFYNDAPNGASGFLWMLRHSFPGNPKFEIYRILAFLFTRVAFLLPLLLSSPELCQMSPELCQIFAE